jgi:hypothetical protein
MENEGRFVDSDVWRQSAQSAEMVDSVAFPVQQEAAMGLTERDLRDLVERLNSGSEKEQYAALRMLLMAVRSNHGSPGFLWNDLREKATQIAMGWVIEKPPPASDKEAVMRYALAMSDEDGPIDVAFPAYALLAAIDKEAAAQFLVSHFPLEGLSTYASNQVIHQLAELCSGDKSKRSDTAMRRLIDIAEKGEPEPKKAAL